MATATAKVNGNGKGTAPVVSKGTAAALKAHETRKAQAALAESPKVKPVTDALTQGLTAAKGSGLSASEAMAALRSAYSKVYGVSVSGQSTATAYCDLTGASAPKANAQVLAMVSLPDSTGKAGKAQQLTVTYLARTAQGASGWAMVLADNGLAYRGRILAAWAVPAATK